MALNDLERNCGIVTVSVIILSLFSVYDYFVSMLFYPFYSFVNRDHR
jgi:hypothetical protein